MKTTRPGVCVLQVPPFAAGRTGTGAQVVTAEVIRALTPLADVTVLHGFTDAVPSTGREIPGLGIRAVPAFAIHPRTLRGTISPEFTPAAQRVLADVRLLVTVECAVTHPSSVPRLVCLGGFGYAHTFDLLAGGQWDHLVVPSEHLAGLVRRHVTNPDTVLVIENGIDLDLFAPLAGPSAPDPTGRRRVRMLVSARPDAIKGLAPTLDLARSLADNGTDVVVRHLRSRLPGADDSLRSALDRRCAGIPVESLAWRNRAAMPAVYRQADLTVCFSGIPEGFGLAAVESIACGTPVLAWPAGGLGALMPPGHGLYLTDREAPPTTWAAAARAALAGGLAACRRGRDYARRRYSAGLMVSRYRDLAVTFLPGDREAGRGQGHVVGGGQYEASGGPAHDHPSP